MTAYSELLRYIKSLAESEEFVNTVTMGEDLDLNKGNIFPLFNVDITGASFTSNSTVSFDVEMAALDVRSINNESEYVEAQGDRGSIVDVNIIQEGRVAAQFPDMIIKMEQESTSGFGSGASVMIRIEDEVGVEFEGVRTQDGGEGSNFAVGDKINVRSNISIEDTIIEVTEIQGAVSQKEVNADKYYGNDNEIDNHNATISVLNNIWVKMHRDFARNNITSSDNPSLEQITFSDKNLLDGWSINFSVEMPTNGVDLCIEC
ncbi:MAG: hypothetical protein GY823_00045 [Flavobacteriaceae bacterium]|nr:hypothetical protein [Flavobacteriaceae bacterium]